MSVCNPNPNHRCTFTYRRYRFVPVPVPIFSKILVPVPVPLKIAKLGTVIVPAPLEFAKLGTGIVPVPLDFSKLSTSIVPVPHALTKVSTGTGVPAVPECASMILMRNHNHKTNLVASSNILKFAVRVSTCTYRQTSHLVMSMLKGLFAMIFLSMYNLLSTTRNDYKLKRYFTDTIMRSTQHTY